LTHCEICPTARPVEDAGLLSKEKLLAGDILPDFAGSAQDAEGGTED